MRGIDWKLAVAGALVGVAAFSAGIARSQAAPSVCRQLQAELASVSSQGSGGPKLLTKYDDAIARQRRELEKARSRARAAGCGFFLLGGTVAQCAALNAAQDRMNRNLDALERKRAALAGSGSRRDRARIRAQLDANGCNNPPGAEAAAAANRPEQQVRIHGGAMDLTSPQPLGDGSVSGTFIEWQGAARIAPGEYRTMCVRTCDGYFFPMSNAASVGNFERDQKNCEASCPGTRMQLFYARGIGADSATMISTATGEPYGNLSTAYLYKRPDASVPPGCGCNGAAQDFRVIAGKPPTEPSRRSDAQELSSFLPVPVARPDPAADPETLANRDGGLDLDALRTLAKKPAVFLPLAEEDRKIRVVGPAFLPDPGAATDPQAPAPKATP